MAPPSEWLLVALLLAVVVLSLAVLVWWERYRRPWWVGRSLQVGGQVRTIVAYDALTKVATVRGSWETAPRTGDAFVFRE